MKKVIKSYPPWPAFVDSIFAVLLIILLIMMIFLVFRILFVVETESSLKQQENIDKRIRTFALQKDKEAQEKEQEKIEFTITEDKFIVKLKYNQSLTEVRIVKKLSNFYQKHPNKDFKMLIDVPISDSHNLRKDVYNKALSLVGKVNDKGEISILLEIKHGINKRLILTSTVVRDSKK